MGCAPMVQREVASLQAQITIDQAGEKLRAQDLTEGLDLKAPAVLICPSCGFENEGGKFCAECDRRTFAMRFSCVHYRERRG